MLSQSGIQRLLQPWVKGAWLLPMLVTLSSSCDTCFFSRQNMSCRVGRLQPRFQKTPETDIKQGASGRAVHDIVGMKPKVQFILQEFADDRNVEYQPRKPAGLKQSQSNRPALRATKVIWNSPFNTMGPTVTLDMELYGTYCLSS